MKLLMITYRLVILIVLIATLHSCASEDRSESKAFAPAQNEYSGQDATMDEESTFEEIETVQNTSQLKKEANHSFSNSKKWKKKAKQQLETLQDLALILQDSTLDEDFQSEIKRELLIIYPQSDSILSTLDKALNFKNFKPLESKKTDTLTLHFKNHKKSYIASFLVVEELKQFGESSETVEQLKLVLIQKEN